jgi:predicted MFS family arabinose efflux permease
MTISLRDSWDRARDRSRPFRDRLTPERVHAPSLDWLNFLIADVRGALGPFVVVYLVSEGHLTPSAAGLLATIGGWIGLTAQTPIGAWLDHTRRKRGMLAVSVLLLAVSALVIVFWPTFWPVLTANALMQVVSGVFEPAVAALTVGLFGADALTRRLGRNAAWSRAGNIVVAVTSGLLAYWLSAKAVFLQVPVIAVLTLIAIATIPTRPLDLRRARGLRSAKDDSDEGPARWLEVLRSRPMLVFAVGSLLYELAAAPLLTLVGQMIGAERHGESLTFTSLCIVASQIGMLMTSIVVGRRADSWGQYTLLLAAFAMLPAQALLTILCGSSAIWLLAVQVFGGLGTGLFYALTPIWLASAAAGRGRYNLTQGIMATFRGLGVTSSSFLTEVLVDHLGYGWAYGVCGIIGLAAALLIWIGLSVPRERRILRTE